MLHILHFGKAVGSQQILIVGVDFPIFVVYGDGYLGVVGNHVADAVVDGDTQWGEGGIVGEMPYEIHCLLKINTALVGIDYGIVDVEQPVLEVFFLALLFVRDKIYNRYTDDEPKQRNQRYE